MKHDLLPEYPILSDSWRDKARWSTFKRCPLSYQSWPLAQMKWKCLSPRFCSPHHLVQLYQMLGCGVWWPTTLSPFYTLAQQFGPETPAVEQQQWKSMWGSPHSSQCSELKRGLTWGSQGNLLFYGRCVGIFGVSPKAFIGEIWPAKCQLDLLANVYIFGVSHLFSWSSPRGPNVGCNV